MTAQRLQPPRHFRFGSSRGPARRHIISAPPSSSGGRRTLSGVIYEMVDVLRSGNAHLRADVPCGGTGKGGGARRQAAADFGTHEGHAEARRPDAALLAGVQWKTVHG